MLLISKPNNFLYGFLMFYKKNCVMSCMYNCCVQHERTCRQKEHTKIDI